MAPASSLSGAHQQIGGRLSLRGPHTEVRFQERARGEAEGSQDAAHGNTSNLPQNPAIPVSLP